MNTITVILLITFVIGTKCHPLPWEDLKIISREAWGARPPKLKEAMPNPVPFVIIHHSYIPPACNNTERCIVAMQEMQRFHQDDRGWNDIGYSFGVGGDGNAYYGRGWDVVGAHAPRYNNRSIGICVIGDWRTELPPKPQLEKVQQLIEYGIHNGYVREDYHLIGHRQVKLPAENVQHVIKYGVYNGTIKEDVRLAKDLVTYTECPGDKLYNLIQNWDHYCSNPDEKHCSDNRVPT